MGKEQAALFYDLDNAEKDIVYDLYKWGLGVPQDVREKADKLIQAMKDVKIAIYAFDEPTEDPTPVHKSK
jgi:hypothetical protein